MLTSSDKFLFAHFPLDKKDYNCLLIVSPNLYYFQGGDCNYIVGCVFIGNSEEYMEFKLTSQMISFTEFYHITIPQTRVCCLNTKKQVKTFKNVSGELRLCKKEGIMDPGKKHSEEKENDDKNKNENKQDEHKQNSINSPNNINSLSRKIGIFDIVSKSKGVQHILKVKGKFLIQEDQVVAAFMAKSYVDVQGFLGEFEFIALNIKPENSDVL